MGKSSQVDPDQARARRLAIQKEISELVNEQQEIYTNYVRPNANAAKMATRGGKSIGPGGATDNVLPVEVVDKMELNTATAKFEYGRTHIARISARVNALRRESNKLGPNSGPAEWRSILLDAERRVCGMIDPVTKEGVVA